MGNEREFSVLQVIVKLAAVIQNSVQPRVPKLNAKETWFSLWKLDGSNHRHQLRGKENWGKSMCILVKQKGFLPVRLVWAR